MPADEALHPVAAHNDGGTGNVDSSTLVVCIDGPSGSGKSTVARGVARTLRLRYLDTGAMYRALTWAVLEGGVNPVDVNAVVAVAANLDLDISNDPVPGAGAVGGVAVAGHDVTAAIRTGAVTNAVSTVSAIPEVRRHMVALQRSIIGTGGIVVEGRDIGTAVCPDAPVKVFLTASPEVRAVRRFAEETDLVQPRDVAAVGADLARRDLLDSTRVTSPLNKAPDAVVLDSTTLDVEGAIAFVVDLVARRLGAVAFDHVGGERP
jgi:cytidylate kinase